MRRRRLSLVVLLALAAVPGLARAAATPMSRPALTARAAILVEADLHRTLIADDASERLPIASTTKLMTAWITVHREPAGRTLTVRPYAAGPGESLSGLPAGARLTVADLLRAMLLPSGNDIAQSLALDVGGGSIARFVGWMNAAARRLGMRATHYSTPIGLDTPGNYSTAADLARLAGAVLSSPLLARIVGERRARLADGHVVVNRNTLLGEVPWVVGVKTGNTAEAGECLVAAGRRDGATVISVVLGEPSEAARDADSLALLRYGLARYRALTPVRAGVVYARVPVSGRPGETVRLFAAHPIGLVTRRGRHPTLALETRGVPADIAGPLSPHTRLGTLEVREHGRVLAAVALVTHAGLAPAPAPAPAIG